jgi:hypothetical protein
MNSGRVDLFERAWFDNEGDGGAMHVGVVGDVAWVEPVPAVAGGRDCTIAPINFVEVKGARSVPSAPRVLGSFRATHQFEPFGPTARIDSGDGSNARHPQPNRRDTRCDDGADHITDPFIVKPNPAESIDPAWFTGSTA